MLETVFCTENVVKKYGQHIALDHVNISIPSGAIYGLIGENGAGKTTLIRMMCGLSRPTQGKIILFGKSDEKEQADERKRMGCLVESPALYPDMTAEQNLEVHRLQRGVPGRSCISKTLNLVGLPNTGKKKAKDFSLGMRQRLALAIALLNEPELLVLDEPVNGLDPMGIVELRKLLIRLHCEKGITILISSHILSEMHQLATHYGILHEGKLLQQITAEALDEKCRKYLEIETDAPTKACAVIEQELKTNQYQVNDNSIRLFTYLDAPELVISALGKAGVIVRKVAPGGENLESYFTTLIGSADDVTN